MHTERNAIEAGARVIIKRGLRTAGQAIPPSKSAKDLAKTAAPFTSSVLKAALLFCQKAADELETARPEQRQEALARIKRRQRQVKKALALFHIQADFSDDCDAYPTLIWRGKYLLITKQNLQETLKKL